MYICFCKNLEAEKGKNVVKCEAVVFKAFPLYGKEVVLLSLD